MFKIILSFIGLLLFYIAFQLYELHKYDYVDDDFAIDISHFEKYAFAGEHFPFEKKAKLKMFERELKNVARHSTEMAIMLRNAELWFPILEPILKRKGIPDDFKYIAVVESNLQANRISNRSAVGFWQIVKGTGLEYGLHINHEIDERYNPVKSTYAACKFFNLTKRYFGNWTNAAASYNMGMPAMIKACKRHRSNSYHDLKLNRESAKYLYKILAYKEVLEYPKKYKLKKFPKKFRLNIRLFPITRTITNFKDWCKKTGLNYAVVMAYNPWIIGNSLTITQEIKRYDLMLPK
jgi:membrane-bound lytic murein transglycosylase D